VKVAWTAEACEDYLCWQATDQAVLRKINELIRDITRDPFRGLGKPEPLRGNLSGWWSRRITGDYRLVYRVTDQASQQAVEIVQCRYHY
jgi:toxin YoeB